MISVAIHPDRKAAAAEFFELFKTEWKFHTPGTHCDVLLTDGTVHHNDDAALLLVFSPRNLLKDRCPLSIHEPEIHGRLGLFSAGESLPLYTPSKLFQSVDEILLYDKKTGHALAYMYEQTGRKIIRVGYDLFDEIALLLAVGQPPENADIPALDRHIAFLRNIIVQYGIQPLIEIPPAPPGHPYMVCLTHDVDFAGIRNHVFDQTFAGFAYRALIDSLRRLIKRRITWKTLLINYRAVLSSPLVYLGLCRDFWIPFDRYRQLEEPHRSTFFLIPFKNRPGEHVSDAHPERRAARYDIANLLDEIKSLLDDGWEFGLHGIDAWHDVDRAHEEREKINSLLKDCSAGTRMHWLLRYADTDQILDEAGFEFDSSCGYNETIGFRAGTSQVFQPLAARRLLEIPLHIQDVSLFYPSFMNLDESSARERCKAIMKHPQHHGGVLTLLWHMRSVAPERLWDGFYKWLIDEASRDGAWFGTARETAKWFRGRRQLKLSSHVSINGQLTIHVDSAMPDDPRMQYVVRVRYPACSHTDTKPKFIDIKWNGQKTVRTGIFCKHKEELVRFRAQTPA